MIRIFFALAILVVAFGGATQAQKKGPNGGPVVTAQGHPIEFVHNDQQIVFFIVDDDGTPFATKNLKGRAVIQDGGKTTTVALSPAAPNKLVGPLQAKIGSKARVVVSVAVSLGGHKHTLQARFTTD